MIFFVIGICAVAIVSFILYMRFLEREREKDHARKLREEEQQRQQRSHRVRITRSTSHHNPVHVQTQKELISELPRDEQLDYTHLFDALDSLEDLIDSYSDDIYREQANVEYEIRHKVQETSEKIRYRWQSQAQRKRYRECLALHYASFTLADSIHEQMKKVGSMYNQIKVMNSDLGRQIDDLSNQISNRAGSVVDLKRQHKGLCDKRHQISQIQKVYGANLKDYNSKLENQNALTAQYRDYIGTNFGAQGRAWLDRLNKRKAARG